MTAWRTTESNDGREPLSAVDAEVWLRALGEALLATQRHADAQSAYGQAVAEVGDRLPEGRDLRGRAQRLLEKQLRILLEREDREGRAS